jgi:hypothetical protein
MSLKINPPRGIPMDGFRREYSPASTDPSKVMEEAFSGTGMIPLKIIKNILDKKCVELVVR